MSIGALHVLVDGLVGLEPGVSRLDHTSALVLPTAILVAAAFAFPRLRAGVRAGVALCLSALFLVGAALAIVGVHDSGMDASAASGLVLCPAGFALLGIGVRDLWRSRKPEGHRILRRIGIGIGAAFLAYELVVPIAFALIATHRPAGTTGPADLGRPYEEVTVRTSDGLDLSGWYVPSENGAAIITFPDRAGTAAQARALAIAGYGVLALDMRGYGDSDGDPNAYGWGSAEDIDAGVRYLRARADVDAGEIGGLGLSVGGEQMIEAAATDDAIKAVVSEGAGERSVRETLLYGAAATLAIPQQAVLTAAVAVFSGDLPPPPLDDLAASISPRFLFLIEAENGNASEELNADYYDAAGPPKELWVIKGAQHTGGIDAMPNQYRERVVRFFDRALLGRGAEGANATVPNSP